MTPPLLAAGAAGGFVKGLRTRRRPDPPLVATGLAAVLRLDRRSRSLARLKGDLLAAAEHVLDAAALRAGFCGCETSVHLPLLSSVNPCLIVATGAAAQAGGLAPFGSAA